MYIKSIYVKSFGRLRELKLDLSERITLITGENESGKSTLSAFIKFVFYGFDKAKKNVSEDEKKHYLSWNDGLAIGSVNIVKDGKEYNVLRANNGKNEKVTVTDLSTGAEVTCPDGAGEFFFGVPSSVYVGTAQSMQCDFPRNGGAELASQIQNIMFSADEDVSVAKALNAIDAERVFLKHKKNDEGGELDRLEARKASLAERLRKAQYENSERIALMYDQKKLSDAKKTAQEELSHYERLLEEERAYEKTKRLEEIEALRELCLRADEEERGRRALLPEDFDEGYLEKLSLAIEADREAASELASAEIKLSAAKKALPADSGAGRSSAEADKEAHAKTLKRKNLLVLLAVVFFIACAGLAAYAALKAPEIFIFAASGALLILGIVFAALSSASSKALKAIEKKYKTDRVGFAAAVGKAIESADDAERSREAYVLARADADSAARRASEARARLCERFGEELTAEDAKAKLESLRDLAAGWKAAKDEHGKRVFALDGILASTDVEELEHIRATVPVPQIPADRLIAEINLRKSKLSLGIEKLSQTEKRLEVLKATGEDPAEVEAELAEVRGDIGSASLRYDALMLAYNALSDAAKEFKEGLAPKITSCAAKLLSEATGGKYTVMTADNDFSVSVIADGEPKSVDVLSGGTKDLVYTAFRYGLLKLIYGTEPPVMIFDDTFSRMDDNRLSMLVPFLVKLSEKTQIVILSCHAREGRLLPDDGVKKIILK